MSLFVFALVSPLLLAVPVAAMSDGEEQWGEAGLGNVQLAQLSIERRVIIRIPMMRRPPEPAARLRLPDQPPPPPPQLRFHEAKGPKCLPLRAIQGASVTPENHVMMFVSGGERMRAHFDRSCRSADFYAGFYIEPTQDGALCSGRDDLHTRNGSTCTIQRFSRLVAEP